MEILNKKQKIIVVIICVVAILIITLYIIRKGENKYSYVEIENTEESKENKKEDVEENKIVLHIAGEVEDEGVIELDKGARVIDAIEEAGGLTGEADISNVNLAHELQDGQKVYIPAKGEEQDNIIEENYIVQTEQEELININTASQTELETISGIGPSTALKIIKYREKNGKFNSIEEIKNVSGIGENKFENIKEKICVK